MTASLSLIERHPGVVDMSIRKRAGVRSYVLGAALSLDTAYAGTTALATIRIGTSFRSRTLLRNRINTVDESNRGLTRIALDPVDFASATVPGDPNICFYRVAEVDLAGNNLGEGPILVVPPPGFFTSGRAVLNLNGTAPNVAGLGNNLPPPDAMIIDFPKFADKLEVFNTGAASLFVSFGAGTQEIEITTTSREVKFNEVGASEVYIRGNGATVTFRMIASLVNGIQG